MTVIEELLIEYDTLTTTSSGAITHSRSEQIEDWQARALTCLAAVEHTDAVAHSLLARHRKIRKEYAQLHHDMAELILLSEKTGVPPPVTRNTRRETPSSTGFMDDVYACLSSMRGPFPDNKSQP